jgi:hypothetical protein
MSSIWQFTGSEGLDEVYVPFFGAFGAAWDDAMVCPLERQSSGDALAGDGLCSWRQVGMEARQPRRSAQWS